MPKKYNKKSTRKKSKGGSNWILVNNTDDVASTQADIAAIQCTPGSYTINNILATLYYGKLPLEIMNKIVEIVNFILVQIIIKYRIGVFTDQDQSYINFTSVIDTFKNIGPHSIRELIETLGIRQNKFNTVKLLVTLFGEREELKQINNKIGDRNYSNITIDELILLINAINSLIDQVQFSNIENVKSLKKDLKILLANIKDLLESLKDLQLCDKESMIAFLNQTTAASNPAQPIRKFRTGAEAAAAALTNRDVGGPQLVSGREDPEATKRLDASLLDKISDYARFAVGGRNKTKNKRRKKKRCSYRNKN